MSVTRQYIQLAVARGDLPQSTLVTEIGPSLYRLEEMPMFCLDTDDQRVLAKLPKFGDTFQTTCAEDGSQVFEKTVKRAPLEHLDYVFTPEINQSEAVRSVREWLSEAGGYSEVVAGGILYVAVPPSQTAEFKEALDAAIVEAFRELGTIVGEGPDESASTDA